MSKPEIFVPLFNEDGTPGWNPDRVVISDPHSNEAKLPSGERPVWYTSDVSYLNDKDEECTLYFQGATQFTSGFYEFYDFGTSDEDKKDEAKRIQKRKGWQLAYNMNSEDTHGKPTTEELQTTAVFDSIWELTRGVLVDVCPRAKKDGIYVPSECKGSYQDYKEYDDDDPEWKNCVKPPYSHPAKNPDAPKEEKIPDTSKPARSYIKLLTTGRGAKLRCNTKIYGPGDIIQSPEYFKGKAGNVAPAFKWDSIYWGKHGAGSDVCISSKVLLAECNYTPGGGKDSGPSERLLRPNAAPKEMVEAGDFHSPSVGGDDEEGENTGFEEGGSGGGVLGGDGSNSEGSESPKTAPRKKVRKGRKAVKPRRGGK